MLLIHHANGRSYVCKIKVWSTIDCGWVTLRKRGENNINEGSPNEELPPYVQSMHESLGNENGEDIFIEKGDNSKVKISHVGLKLSCVTM